MQNFLVKKGFHSRGFSSNPFHQKKKMETQPVAPVFLLTISSEEYQTKNLENEITFTMPIKEKLIQLKTYQKSFQKFGFTSKCSLVKSIQYAVWWTGGLRKKYLSTLCQGLTSKQIKSSLYSRYYSAAYNEWRGPSTRLSPGQHSPEET